MADQTSTILLNIKVTKDQEIQNRVKAIEELTDKVTELKEANKQLAKSDGDNTEAIITNKAAIKALNSEIAARNKEVAALVKANQAELGSNNQLKAAIQLLEGQYAALGKTQRESMEGQVLQNNLKALRDELNANKKAAGDFTSNIGRYEQAVEGVTLSIGEMKKQLRELKGLSFAGKTQEEIAAIQQKIGTLTNDLADMQAKVKAADSGELFNNLAGSLQGVVNGVQILSAGLQALGVESEFAQRLEKSTLSLISATQALQSIRDLKDKGTFAATALQIKEIANTTRQTVVTWAQTNAEAAKVAMTGKASIATKAYAAVQLFLNKVIAANPIMAMVAALTAVAAATYIVVRALTNVTQAEKDAQQAREISNKTIQDAQSATGEMVTKLRYYQGVANDTTKTEKERKNALEQIRKESGDVIKVTDLSASSLQNLNAQMEVYIKNAVARAKVDSLLKQLAETQIEITNRQTGLLKEEAAFYEASALTQIRSAQALEDAKKKETAITKQLNDAMSEQVRLDVLDTKGKQENTKATNNNNKAKDEAAERLKKEKELLEQQKANEKEYRDYIEKTTNEVNQIIFNSYEIRLNEAKDAESKMLDVLERAKMAELITTEKYEEKKAIVAAEYNKQRLDLEAEFRLVKLEEIYNEETARHSTNELEKLKLSEQYIKDQIAAKKKANQSTAELEAQLADNTRAIRQKELDIALLENADHFAKQYDLRKEFLQKELELARGNKEKELLIEAELAAEKQAYREAVLEEVQKYTNASSQLLTEASDAQRQREDEELIRYEAMQERKKSSLTAQLNAGAISEREYNNLVKNLDEQTAKKKSQLARQQAVRDKALRSFEAIINTAAAVTEVIANPILAAIVAAAGAVQIATIAGTDIPKAARGKLVKGRSHAAGGEIIEAENNEAVINAQATSRYLPILDAINQSTGGVPLMTGGFAERQSMSIAQSNSNASMTEAFIAAAQQIRPVVSVDQINRVNNEVQVIQGRATY